MISFLSQTPRNCSENVKDFLPVVVVAVRVVVVEVVVGIVGIVEVIVLDVVLGVVGIAAVEVVDIGAGIVVDVEVYSMIK